jgi:hypothetical protein
VVVATAAVVVEVVVLVAAYSVTVNVFVGAVTVVETRRVSMRVASVGVSVAVTCTRKVLTVVEVGRGAVE